ncbi:hypothetical protein ILYODFUR_036082 [Ilyodon furcidens]|uniref:Uncharacterized protein n=1 Tax=Ilyodon furcidens TaxID=33524 RepID=A0ABV0UM71_9TELE
MTAERIIRADIPSIQDLTGLGSEKELQKSWQTPCTLHKNCLEFCLQAAATEHCLLKPAATETVSSPRLFLCGTFNRVPNNCIRMLQMHLFIYICVYLFIVYVYSVMQKQKPESKVYRSQIPCLYVRTWQ